MTPHTIEATDTISMILERQPRAARIFIRLGMHCVGCAMTRHETLTEACATYGISPDVFLSALNAKGKRRQRPSRGSR